MTLERNEPVDLAVRRAYAKGLGAPGESLDDGHVLVVERPDDHWGFVAFGAAFAHGTLVAVAADLLDAARDAAPDDHGPGALLQILSAVRDTAHADGLEPALHAPAIAWAIAERPLLPPLPRDLHAETIDADALNSLLDDGRFENGAGRRDRTDARSFRNYFGQVVRVDGEIVAVAGVFHTYGLHEIGVDVTAEWRGRGLGRTVVSAAIDEILARDEVPFYACSATNIVSQRTALSTGFRPVMADAFIN